MYGSDAKIADIVRMKIVTRVREHLDKKVDGKVTMGVRRHH
jgi:hypothetical protein